MSTPITTPIIGALAEVSDRYDALFCDLWGCLHDGVRALPGAVAALRGYRARGGIVVLVTNAPRPRDDIAAQLDALGVPRDAWDTIATSGDAARAAMYRGAVGARVWVLGGVAGGPDASSFFVPPGMVADPVDVVRVPLDAAEGIVALGPDDPLADPAVMRGPFLSAIARGLPMLCANPDIVVDRGHSREWCAGALAALYEEMGGTALYFGKPHAPIYDLARQRLAAAGHDIADGQILAVGDGIGTDVAGGLGEGLDTLFVTGGLAAAETGTGDHDGTPDGTLLDAFVARHALSPTYAIGGLR